MAAAVASAMPADRRRCNTDVMETLPEKV